MTIPDLLAARARESADQIFAVTDHGEYSFAVVESAVRGFAGELQRRGLQVGDHVALVAGNSAAYLVAWFAINLAGGVAVTLNTQIMGESLRYMLAQSDATAIVADRDWVAARSGDLDEGLAALPLVMIEDEATFISRAVDLPPPEPPLLRASAPATIMYTSGTTGLPKGVVNSHAAYLAAGRHTALMLELSPSDRCMVVLPLFHANPQMYAVMSALQVGSTLVLRERFSASAFFDDARRFRATGFTFVGTILSILASRHSRRERDHALRFCLGGGAPLKVWREVEERFGVAVHELYGMTEVGGWVTANTVKDRRLGSCGRARPDMEVRVVDEDDREVGPERQGEIVVRPREPDVILSGYYRQPDKMVEACRNLWFHTGDRGSFDADGYLFFHGRIKELIRRGGEMISPVEIETSLRKMPGIADCAVVGVDDDVLGQEVKAVVVGAAEIPPASLRDYLAQHLPAFMLPRYVEFIDAVPKTETEKIQRHKIAYVDGRVHDLKPGR